MDRLIAFTMALAWSAAVTVAHGSDANASPRVGQAAQQRSHAPGPHGATPRRFDIASQPLHAALDAFSAITGWSGFYSADATAGHVSNTLLGWYAPDVALGLLMEGRGLAVHYTAHDAFVLEPVVAASPALSSPPLAQTQPVQPVEALLQAGMRKAFCADPNLARGDFRVAFSLNLGPRGRVRDVRLLGSTGSAARDAAVLAALQKIDIGASAGSGAPAADVAQPFVMLVLPRPATSRECAAVP
ncbi:MAG: hypothetical protein EOP81_01475 [Variovorax sp.]|nr:MAG: hypothetical protein EOP81_01475 [Variovorax sp.]